MRWINRKNVYRVIEHSDELYIHSYRKKKKSSRKSLDTIISEIMATAIGILLLLLMASYFLQVIPAFYKYTGVLVPTLFNLLVATVILVFATRTLRKRLKFECKLKKLCRDKGYLIERNVSMLKSLRFVTEGHHFIIETPKVRFVVRYMTFRKHHTKITFRSNKEVDMTVNLNASKSTLKVLFGIKEKTKAFHFDFDEKFYDRDKEVRKIVLMNPVPFEVNYINKDGVFSPTGSGQEMFGFTIYNGSGFLSMLRELD